MPRCRPHRIRRGRRSASQFRKRCIARIFSIRRMVSQLASARSGGITTPCGRSRLRFRMVRSLISSRLANFSRAYFMPRAVIRMCGYRTIAAQPGRIPAHLGRSRGLHILRRIEFSIPRLRGRSRGWIRTFVSFRMIMVRYLHIQQMAELPGMRRATQTIIASEESECMPIRAERRFMLPAKRTQPITRKIAAERGSRAGRAFRKIY